MPGRVVATVDVNVDLDASRLPAQARRAGDEAGKNAAKGWDDNFEPDSAAFSRFFNRTLINNQAERAGRGAGNRFGAEFDAVWKGDWLRKAFDFSDVDIGRRIKAAFNDIDFDKVGSTADRLSMQLSRNSFHWRDLSHNARQWILIGTAIAVGLQDLAVLSSAAGAGLIVLGGALSSTALGVGTMVAAFKDLGQDVSTLPAGLRSAATAFQQLQVPLGKMQDFIEVRALGQTTQAWQSLGNTITGLTPAFGPLADVVGRMVNSFAKELRPGTENFETLFSLVRKSAPIFESLAGSAGTLGSALLRSFERSTPYVQDFVGWIDILISRFDTFSRGNSFLVWMENARRIFGDLGGLLDSTGRMLNNLVTPEAVDRTSAFIRNLDAFMPNLGRFLDNLGRVDPFGLLARGLNEMGQALFPLAGPIGELADSVNRVATIFIDRFAAALGLVSTLAAPLATALSNILDALPVPMIEFAATAVIGLAGAFATLRIMGAVDRISSGLATFALGANAAEGATSKLAGSISAGIGRAAFWGVVAGAVLQGAAALQQFARSVDDVEGKARNAIASNSSLADSYQTLGKAPLGVGIALRDVSGALDQLATVGHGPEKFFATFGATFSETGRQASQLANTLNELDAPLATLANQNLPAAVSQFSAWASELGATDAQVLNMVNSMPQFQAALESASYAQGGMAASADLVNLALGRETAAQGAASSAADTSTAALAALQGKSDTTGAAIDGLADKIRGFGGATLDAREANRRMEEAFTTLTDSVAANGQTLDITTAAGRANESAIDAMARAALTQAGATYTQTGSIDAASAALQTQRDRLIATMEGMGMSRAEAERYVDQLGLIPSNIPTQANLTLNENGVEARLNYISRARVANITANITERREAGLPLGGMASGGILTGPRRVLAGEAGREAFVPLDRPLDRVDKSVRWLAAIAQGKGGSMASGGVVGGGRQITIAPGAIVVMGAQDPEATALAVMNRITEDL